MDLAVPELNLELISEEQLLFNPGRYTFPRGNTEGTGCSSCSNGGQHG